MTTYGDPGVPMPTYGTVALTRVPGAEHQLADYPPPGPMVLVTPQLLDGLTEAQLAQLVADSTRPLATRALWLPERRREH